MKKLSLLFIILIFTLSYGHTNAQEGPPVLQAPTPSPELPPTPPPPPSRLSQPVNPLPPPPQKPIEINMNNIPGVLATARKAKRYFSAGKVWVHRGPAGDIIIKGAILYRGTAIGTIRFNPVTGNILPCGYEPRQFYNKIPLEIARQKLPSILSDLRVLNGVEFRERENCWVVPLAYHHAIVAHLKVTYDGLSIVPDYPATQEMNYVK